MRSRCLLGHQKSGSAKVDEYRIGGQKSSREPVAASVVVLVRNDGNKIQRCGLVLVDDAA
jgi:hypothetical protein